MKATLCFATVFILCISPAANGEGLSPAERDRIQTVIDAVEEECLTPPYVYTIGIVKAKRLAELVRERKPQLVVECGSAVGYSGLWIARELKAVGGGKLITIEIDPETAQKAQENFRKAGLADLITLKVGDATKLVKEIAGPIDFAFIDCNGENYLPCFLGMEKNLSPGAVVVADNVGVSPRQVRNYLKHVRTNYESREEWFDVNLPWAKRDSMEVTIIKPPQTADNVPPPGFRALFNGRDFTGWNVPEGDGGHWKIIDGVIDYDAQSEAKGDKSLWHTEDFGDFVLRVDWRIKETPYVNPNVPYILPDGTHARDIHGKEYRFSLPDSDSGIYLRGSGKNQVNIWCWPIGSGEFYGYRTDSSQPPEVRAGVTPRTQADTPVGEWNTFEITVRSDRVKVVLNGKVVIPDAQLPGVAPRGPIGLQHHGGKGDGQWTGPPSLLQFKNIFIKELDI
ncbi:MAG: DUF1080 domain-containing protein [bacterium]|nr:DUF1080 domain-containing protein [bacterium]